MSKPENMLAEALQGALARFAAPGTSDKREKILDAALTLFAERGFHGTPVPLVAEKARVGAGTVYRYFESKEALANVLFRRWKLEFAKFVLGDLDPELPTRAAFHRVWRKMFAFREAHPGAMKFLELHNHRTYLDAESATVEQQVLSPIRDFVVAAQQRGEVRRIAPEVAMAVVFGAYVGLVRAAEEGFLALTEKVIQDSETAAWGAIAA
ncbi:MAG TPA: TetR/AcrR family transcriptional regulator [Haliangiales bacterium]|nr:TetR/AcrR family transcriptional regulator [Haliangiales bacterium]